MLMYLQGGQLKYTRIYCQTVIRPNEKKVTRQTPTAGVGFWPLVTRLWIQTRAIGEQGDGYV